MSFIIGLLYGPGAHRGPDRRRLSVTFFFIRPPKEEPLRVATQTRANFANHITFCDPQGSRSLPSRSEFGDHATMFVNLKDGPFPSVIRRAK